MTLPFLLGIISASLAFALPLNKTLGTENFINTLNNPAYPFTYEVPFLVALIHHNETLRKNFTIGNPYADEPTIRRGSTAYWLIQYCGVHFINKGEGYVLSDKAFPYTESAERCNWGFVGDQHCTPEIECTSFLGRGGNCRTNYLQITDLGLSFNQHFCDEPSMMPTKETYIARDGVLDVVYRYTKPEKRPAFTCWVQCVNYPVNYTVTGSNAVGKEPLVVTVHAPDPIVKDNIPPPQVDKNCKCGVANEMLNRTKRVVGGRETLQNQYPWTVGILSKNGKLPYCGASLIADQYILTAQHCVEDEDLEDIIIVLNEHNFHNNSERMTLRRGVVEVIPYNYYMESTFSGDIALLRLEKPVSISHPHFTPACLPYSLTELWVGREVWGTGWGTTDGGPFATKSPTLREVPLVVLPNQACNDYHSHQPPEPPQVLENMLCAGYSEGGRDTCAGDSGGPLVVRENDQFVQVGVTSWGFGCAIKLNPGVFSRVSEFMYWIRMHTVDAHLCNF